MREAAAAGPSFKAVSRTLSTVLFRASSGEPHFNAISAITAAIRYFIY
jgi:hypothetical protein